VRPASTKVRGARAGTTAFAAAAEAAEVGARDGCSAPRTIVGQERKDKAANIIAPLRSKEEWGVARGVNVTRDEG
jgi:hypothetical protein